jgi:class 3 adenylate cyclase
MHYVAPVVIEAMLKDPARLKLGGDEKVLTVLFSDLQGFTAASERYTPHEMIELLSEYYARMTEQMTAGRPFLDDGGTLPDLPKGAPAGSVGGGF